MDRVNAHPLRREIIATAITNSLINRMGPVFSVRTQSDTGADPAAIARAYTIAREVLGLRDTWAQIEALDNRVSAATQYAAIEQTTRILRHMSYWLLTHHRKNLDIEPAVRRFQPGTTELLRDMAAILGADEHARFTEHRTRLLAERVPEALAVRIAALDGLHGALDLVEVAAATRVAVGYAGRVYFDLGQRIGLAWIRQQIESLLTEGHWHAVARRALLDNLYALQRKLTAAALACAGKEPAARVDSWLLAHRAEVDYLRALILDLRTGSAPDFATLSVALQSVRRLAGE
jgi:glutamate dehydrogenase